MLRTQFAFLAFRPIHVSVQQDFWRWFAFVLVITWLVGIGRYWDHPSADLWQYLGAGSVGYILCLSLLLHLVVWPLRPSNWTYRGVLIFVGLTSLPAMLYAIPIERVVDLKVAQSINAWFLGIVAIWRVALLLRYLTRSAQLSWSLVTVVSVMLLSGIVFTLFAEPGARGVRSHGRYPGRERQPERRSLSRRCLAGVFLSVGVSGCADSISRRSGSTAKICCSLSSRFAGIHLVAPRHNLSGNYPAKKVQGRIRC